MTAQLVTLQVKRICTAVALLLCACTETSSTPVAVSSAALTTSLGAVGDTYVTSLLPNQNHGGETFFRLQPIGKNRGVVFFDPSAIRQAVGTNTLISAHLSLPIQSASNWGASGRPQGRSARARGFDPTTADARWSRYRSSDSAGLGARSCPRSPLRSRSADRRRSARLRPMATRSAR